MRFTEALQAGEVDILLWINNIDNPISPIQIPKCCFFLKEGTSQSDWGAVLIKGPLMDTLH